MPFLAARSAPLASSPALTVPGRALWGAGASEPGPQAYLENRQAAREGGEPRRRAQPGREEAGVTGLTLTCRRTWGRCVFSVPQFPRNPCRGGEGAPGLLAWARCVSPRGSPDFPGLSATRWFGG